MIQSPKLNRNSFSSLATLIPGMIDAHIHTFSAAQMGIFEDIGLTQFSSIEAALEHMMAVGQQSKPGDWLLFTNFDFGTQTSANSKMIELMAVDSETKDPAAGGTYG